MVASEDHLVELLVAHEARESLLGRHADDRPLAGFHLGDIVLVKAPLLAELYHRLVIAVVPLDDAEVLALVLLALRLADVRAAELAVRQIEVIDDPSTPHELPLNLRHLRGTSGTSRTRGSRLRRVLVVDAVPRGHFWRRLGRVETGDADAVARGDRIVVVRHLELLEQIVQVLVRYLFEDTARLALAAKRAVGQQATFAVRSPRKIARVAREEHRVLDAPRVEQHTYRLLAVLDRPAHERTAFSAVVTIAVSALLFRAMAYHVTPERQQAVEVDRRRDAELVHWYEHVRSVVLRGE